MVFLRKCYREPKLVMASRFSLTLLHGHFSRRLKRTEAAWRDCSGFRRGGDQIGVIRRCLAFLRRDTVLNASVLL